MFDLSQSSPIKAGSSGDLFWPLFQKSGRRLVNSFPSGPFVDHPLSKMSLFFSLSCHQFRSWASVGHCVKREMLGSPPSRAPTLGAQPFLSLGSPTLWAHIFARHKNHMFIDISKHVTENTTHTKQSAKNQKWPKWNLAQLELGLRGKTRGVIRTLAQVESARVVLSSCSSIGRDDVIHGRRTPFALKRLAKQTRHERSCVNYALSKQHKTAVTITAPNKRSSPNSWVVLFSLLSPVGCCFSFAFGAVRFCHLSPSRAVLPSPPCWLCIIPLLGSGAALVAVPLFLWVGPLSTLSSFSLDERKEVLLSLLGGVAFLLLWGGVVCLRLLGFGWCSHSIWLLKFENYFNEKRGHIIEKFVYLM